jgi:hypothetical protein
MNSLELTLYFVQFNKADSYVCFYDLFILWSYMEFGTNYLCTYDLCGPVHNAFDAGSIHYEGKWEGVGRKKLEISGANPLPLARVMDTARIKHIMHRAV